MSGKYHAPTGGHPPQTQLLTDPAVLTDAYAVLLNATMRDIVTSSLLFWEQTRLWVIARPMSGFAETFSHYIIELAPVVVRTNPKPTQARRLSCSSLKALPR